MGKFCTILILLLITATSKAETFLGQIVTLEKDTINVQVILRGSAVFDTNRIIELQMKVKVLHNHIETEYLPEDLLSFRVKLDEGTYTFDNIKGRFFAQRLYSGKVKLFKVLKRTDTYSGTVITKYYMIGKPTTGQFVLMLAGGFSRLIKKDELLPAIGDCNSSYDKIETDQVKIRNEVDLIEFIKDYEKECFWEIK